MEDKNNTTVKKALEIFRNGWNKQIILYGPPGTSKTYSAVEVAARFLADSELEKPDLFEGTDHNKTINHQECENYLAGTNRYKVIQFHPSYSYEDFVRGIVVKPGSGQVPTYEVERKIIETFGEGASKEAPRVLVIDEINRAPLGSVLGELIYGLEYRGQAVSTPYVIKGKAENGSNGKDIETPLKVSEDLYIIGTMNTADRSIGTMDYAVRRRFAFIPVLPDSSVIAGTWTHVGKKVEGLFNTLMDKENGIFANKYLEDQETDVNDIKIGHTYFLGKKRDGEPDRTVKEEDEDRYLTYRIRYQVWPVYQEYVKDGLIKKDGLIVFKTIVENKIGLTLD